MKGILAGYKGAGADVHRRLPGAGSWVFGSGDVGHAEPTSWLASCQCLLALFKGGPESHQPFIRFLQVAREEESNDK